MKYFGMLIFVLVSTTASAKDFSLSVTIEKAGEPSKVGVVEVKSGKCRTMNGPTPRMRDPKLCRGFAEEVAKNETTYSSLPWINNPDVASLTVKYRDVKHEWTKITGLKPDPQSKAREALRELAVKVLETAQ